MSLTLCMVCIINTGYVLYWVNFVEVCKYIVIKAESSDLSIQYLCSLQLRYRITHQLTDGRFG